MLGQGGQEVGNLSPAGGGDEGEVVGGFLEEGISLLSLDRWAAVESWSLHSSCEDQGPPSCGGRGRESLGNAVWEAKFVWEPPE